MATDPNKAADAPKANEVKANDGAKVPTPAPAPAPAPNTAAVDEKSNTEASQSPGLSTHDAAVADEATKGGAQARKNSAVAADSDKDNARALTRLQAARQSAVDSVSPSSTTLQNPDAEMRAEMTNDVLTAQRESLQQAARENGTDDSTEQELADAHQAVADAQLEVNNAVRKRDEARTAYDRLVDARQSTQRGDVAVSEYLTAMNERREREAKLKAAQENKILSA